MVLVLLTSISSYAQTGSDTVKCYSLTELRRIAAQIVKKQECDTLLKITNKQLALKLEVIEDQKIQIDLLNKESTLKEGIIKDKESKIQGLEGSLSKQKRRNKWLKFGWAATGIAIVGYLLIK